ncbi:MAG TPA: thermonuclease family protein, partial [Burkholderiaceae bacterium]|nr:thermonuclease family protein [Burkholderiaceae bacterium]
MNGRCLAAPLLAMLVACAAAATTAEPVVHGRVVHVHDGDSFVLQLADGQREQVRLAGIDAPEKGQPHADESRDALRALLHEQRVRVQTIKRDAFGRRVAEVFRVSDELPELDAALAQLQAGMAWHFVRYLAEQSPAQQRRYAAAERKARNGGAGLWREPQPVPPWEFRTRARRGVSGSNASGAPSRT